MTSNILSDLVSQTQSKGSFNEILLTAHCTQSKRKARVVAHFVWMVAVMDIAIRQHIPSALILGWALFSTFLMAARILLVQRLPTLSHISLHIRMRWAVAFTIAIVVSTASPILMFPGLTELELAVISFWLVAHVAAASSASAGWRAQFMAYSWTIVPILFIKWIPVGFDSNWLIKSTVCVGILLFVSTANNINHDILKLFKFSFDANIEMEKALTDAEESSRAKTRFLASASHDLRQPLHTLTLFTGALSLQSLPEQSKELINKMDKVLRSLGIQLNALLDMSKLDAGIIRPNFSDHKLYSLLWRVGKEFEPVAIQKKLDLVISCAPDLAVRTDAVLCERIIRNLVDNAIKYTQYGVVSVLAEAEDDHVVISIKDTGEGISKSEQGKVFEEFYQINNPERDSNRGLGLGLSIVSRLTKLMNLPISLKSDLGCGTEVNINLPSSSQSEISPAVKQFSINSRSLENIRILIVDDEQNIRDALSNLIESMGGQAVSASSSEEAIAIARNNQLDVMLCDYRLRGKDSGLQTISRLREFDLHLPVLMISGDTAPERLLEAHKAGARLLHKPVPAEILCEEIFRSLIGGRPFPLSMDIKIGD